MDTRPVNRWKRSELQLSNRKSIPSVCHWGKEGEPQEAPPSDIPIHPSCIVEYTGMLTPYYSYVDEEYVNAKCASEAWDKKETDFLFSLCRTYRMFHIW